MNGFVRGVLVLALAVGVLGFGAIGLCGGYFTLAFVPEIFSPGGANGLVFLALSLPCLMGGFFMVLVCARTIGRLLGLAQLEEKDTR